MVFVVICVMSVEYDEGELEVDLRPCFHVVELLGQRLLDEGDNSLKKSALVCFVCAGNVNQLLNNWSLCSNSADDVQVSALAGEASVFE